MLDTILHRFFISLTCFRVAHLNHTLDSHISICPNFILQVVLNFNFTQCKRGAQSQSAGHPVLFPFQDTGRTARWDRCHQCPLAHRENWHTDHHLESPQVCLYFIQHHQQYIIYVLVQKPSASLCTCLRFVQCRTLWKVQFLSERQRSLCAVMLLNITIIPRVRDRQV